MCADPAGPRLRRAWEALATVEDPEIPAVGIVDLGLVRGVEESGDGTLRVRLSPTYVGCPATDVIRGLVEEALRAAALAPFEVRHVLSPAWSSDWISPEGRRKLAANAIVPPERAATAAGIERGAQPVACPHCGSIETDCVSEFGSTPCKALHRCGACLEPFERFKCL